MRNGKNHNGHKKNNIPPWVKEWFIKLNDITMDLELGHRESRQMIKENRERIRQNEKTIEELKKANEWQKRFNTFVAKKLGAGYHA